MPLVGLGLWRVSDDEAARIVGDGVESGYRLLDTASMYGNEKGVGQGIRDCPLPRDQLFVTTKVWNDCHGYHETMSSFENSLRKMRLEYLDLYLIHWPVAGSEKYLDTWKAMIQLREEGKVISIGVSNFLQPHLQRLIDATGVAPEVNQIECHPYFPQHDLVDANVWLGIQTECWAPLGRGMPLEEAAILSLVRKYGKTPAQIALRWNVEQGRVVIPKTGKKERMLENIDVFDFQMSPEDISSINAITTTHRIGDDPNTFVIRSFDP